MLAGIFFYKLLAGFLALLLVFVVVAGPVSAAKEEDEDEAGSEEKEAGGGKAEASWSLAKDFHWVGKVDPAAGSLDVAINGKKPGRFVLNTYKDAVHAGFILERGDNLIIIRQGEKDLYRKNIVYAAGYDAKVPDDLPVYAFHDLEKEKDCAGCHRMEPGEADKKPQTPQDSMCHGCHRPMFAGLKSQHKPFVLWQCLECHKAEASESEALPDQKVRYVISEGLEIASECYRCHKKEEETFGAYEFQHGPVAENLCTSCHDPHGSGQPKLLHQKEVTLCVDCHEMADILEEPVVHRVITEKGCKGCHDPHGSSHRLQLKQEPLALCLDCHKELLKLRGNHPVKGHPTDGVPDPRDKKKTFGCTSCHSPHASAGDKLLPEEEVMMVCVKCHKR